MTERPELAVPGQRHVSETHGAVADRMTQHVRHIAAAISLAGAGFSFSGCGRAACGFFGLAFEPIAVTSAGDSGVGLGRDEQVDGRQALVVHAPAVVQIMVERDWITVADGVRPAALKVPPRSTQSRLRITSASFTALIMSSVAKVAGYPRCSG